MNAPLSRFLTRFSDADVSLAMPVPFEVVALEPEVTLGASELQARLDAARAEARRDADAEHALLVEDLKTSHAASVEATVAEARRRWVADESAAHAEQVAAGFAALETMLSSRIASALRPLVATAMVERACEAVREALDHILADPDHPAVTVSGPADLIESIRAARPAGKAKPERVAFVVADSLELMIESAGTNVETRIVAALAALEEF